MDRPLSDPFFIKSKPFPQRMSPYQPIPPFMKDIAGLCDYIRLCMHHTVSVASVNSITIDGKLHDRTAVLNYVNKYREFHNLPLFTLRPML